MCGRALLLLDNALGGHFAVSAMPAIYTTAFGRKIFINTTTWGGRYLLFYTSQNIGYRKPVMLLQFSVRINEELCLRL